MVSLQSFGFVAAFMAGLVSFLSPCVFPLVPGYLSYIAGTTIREAESESAMRWRVSAHALFFVLGFALIFTMFGAIASAIGVALHEHKQLLERSAGALLVLFGIVMTGLIPLPFVQRERRAHVDRGDPALLRSALIGVAFGAGWSPCIGPILGSIFALASTSATLTQGVFLLLVYALGLGMPFLVVGLMIDRVAPLVRRINRYIGPVSVVSGAIVALTGVLVLSGRLESLASYGSFINL